MKIFCLERMRTLAFFCFTSTQILQLNEALAAAAQVHGRGAVVGEYSTGTPPNSTTYQGFRVPFGLTFEGRASNNLSLFLDLQVSYNNSPRLANSLGNTSASESANGKNQSSEQKNKGNEVAQPLLFNGGRGEKAELAKVGYAYLQYASDVGLFKAGRMPRHWGLGLWRNAEWIPEGGTLTTSDALSATFDLTSTFSGSLYFEKISEGSGASLQDDADAFTVEALLADDPADVGASGITRQIGITFSSYDHKMTSTRIRFLDMYARVYAAGLGIEGEVLYPSGDTKSLSYSAFGGSAERCPPKLNPDNNDVTCQGQRIEGLAALLKLKYQVAGTPAGPDNGVSLSATESARLRMPTSLLGESHVISIWAGYTRGDSDAFSGVKNPDNTIRSTPMHPNIRPAFLMYNHSSENTPAGMPGNTLFNTVFVRGDYTYEGPGFGSITPSLIWGRLDQTNTKQDQIKGAVGRSKNLGVEFDLNYAYRTADNVKLSLDAGVWVPGGAWTPNGGSKPSPVYGMRTTASTSF